MPSRQHLPPVCACCQDSIFLAFVHPVETASSSHSCTSSQRLPHVRARVFLVFVHAVETASSSHSCTPSRQRLPRVHAPRRDMSLCGECQAAYAASELLSV